MFRMVPLGLFHIFFSLNSKQDFLKKKEKWWDSVDQRRFTKTHRLVPRRFTFHSGFVGSDGGTLHRNVVLLGGQRRVDGDLVVRLVAVRQTQVVVL